MWWCLHNNATVLQSKPQQNTTQSQYQIRQPNGRGTLTYQQHESSFFFDPSSGAFSPSPPPPPKLELATVNLGSFFFFGSGLVGSSELIDH